MMRSAGMSSENTSLGQFSVVPNHFERRVLRIEGEHLDCGPRSGQLMGFPLKRIV
jgi:hypothetical protein